MNSDKEPTFRPILFPTIIACSGKVMITRKQPFEMVIMKRRIENDRFLLRWGQNPATNLLWLLDRNGHFRRVNHMKTLRSWAKCLSKWLWDFTMREVEICPPQTISAGEMLEHLNGMKSASGASDVQELRKFFIQLPDEHILTHDDIRRFWKVKYPKLEKSEWSQQIPAHE